MSKNIVRGFVSILGARFGRVAISLVLTPLLVRLLGSGPYGQYAFAISVFTPLMTLINMGLFQGVRKFVGERPKDPHWRNGIFGFCLRLAALPAGIGIIVVLLSTTLKSVTSLVGTEFGAFFYIVALMIPFHQAFILGRGMLMALELEHISEPIHLLQQLLLKGLGIVFVLLGLGAAGALWGYAASLIVAAMLSMGFVFRNLDVRSILDPPPLEISAKDVVGFNSLSVVHAFLVGSLLNIDIVLIQIFLGSNQTGYYKAALVISGFLWFVPGALNTMLLHSTSTLWAEQQYERLTALASRATRYALIAIVILVIGLAILADSFVPLYYGESFTSAILPLLLLLPGTVGYAVVRPIMAIIQSKGSLRLMIAATGSAAIINLILNFLLIPRYGMKGAAVATSIGYGSMLVFHLLSARTLKFNPLADLRVGRIAGSGTVAGIGIVFASSQIPSGLLSLFIVPPLGLLVYVAALFLFGAVGINEARDIASRI